VQVKTLVGYDGSEPARRAIAVAAELAKRSGNVDVGVVHVIGPRPEPGVDAEAEQEALLAEARKLVGEAGRSASTLRRRGDVAGELIEAAREIDADLLVLGSRGRGALSSALLGSVSAQVAATASCPVVVVPPRGRLTGGPIIAGVDGSQTSGEVVGVAEKLGRLCGAPVLLAHAYTLRPVPGASAVPHAWEELVRADRERAQETISEAARKHGFEEDATRLAEGLGDIDALIELSEREDAAAIVVGSRGRRALKAAVLGSFSSTLAARESCPVVIVPPGAGVALPD
jgi:nucleotide-binding universal stress UspA family protein